MSVHDVSADLRRAEDDLTRRGRPAVLQVRGFRGLFVAECCRVTGSRVDAVGCWVQRCGLNYADKRIGNRREYTWPIGRVVEIRWDTEASA